MNCGLCKRPLKSGEQWTTDHYQCSVDMCQSFRDDIEKLTTERDKAASERDRLRAALSGLVGVSTREELEAMELFMRAAPAPAEDKAVSIDAIHALLATVVHAEAAK